MAPIYCIDTSSFIHTWVRDYPIDVFPSVWEKFDDMGRDGRILSCQEVLLELERGGDGLYDWAKARPHLFHPPDTNIQKIVSQIVSAKPDFIPETSADGVWADPYVIAFAASRKGMVITGEVLAPNNSKKIKIPNICKEMGIDCGNMLGMLRSEKFNL